MLTNIVECGSSNPVDLSVKNAPPVMWSATQQDLTDTLNTLAVSAASSADGMAVGGVLTGFPPVSVTHTHTHIHTHTHAHTHTHTSASSVRCASHTYRHTHTHTHTRLAGHGIQAIRPWHYRCKVTTLLVCVCVCVCAGCVAISVHGSAFRQPIPATEHTDCW